MRRALPLVVLLAVSLAPFAAAQTPDPSAVVGLVCSASGDARDLLPVCPQEEPAAPAEPPAAEEAHAAHQDPAAPAEDPAGAAAGLADQARETVEGAAADPASAPDRVVAFLATLLQIVRDLLGLPALGFRAMLDGAALLGGLLADAASATGHALAEGATTLGQAVGGAFAKVGEAASAAWSAVTSLFADASPGGAADGARLPAAPPLGAPDAMDLVEQTLGGALPQG